VAVGKNQRDLGMPVCTASVEFSARGYRSLLGWVQLVREPSMADRFKIDPFDLFADSSAPLPGMGSGPCRSTLLRVGALQPESGGPAATIAGAVARTG
jgi:hypothetical protein